MPAGRHKEHEMARLAFMTSGVLLAPYGDPRVQGLADRTPAAFAAAEASVGFIARWYEDAAAEANTWGEWAAPAIFRGAAYQDRVSQTLSLWRDLESVF